MLSVDNWYVDGKYLLKISSILSNDALDPCISESCIEVKIKLIFFSLACGATKGFIKAFKALMVL